MLADFVFLATSFTNLRTLMEEVHKSSWFGDKRFIVANIGVLIGLLALGSEVSSQRDTLPGWAVLFGSLAYKFAKKRRLGLVPDTNLRKVLEVGVILLIALSMLLTDRSTMVNDPVPYLVLPLWVVIAYIVILVKKA